jgi:hypothetical protein
MQTVRATIMPTSKGSYPSFVMMGKNMGVARIIKARSSIKEPPSAKILRDLFTNQNHLNFTLCYAYGAYPKLVRRRVYG